MNVLSERAEREHREGWALFLDNLDTVLAAT